jgi:hypothetical protein
MRARCCPRVGPTCCIRGVQWGYRAEMRTRVLTIIAASTLGLGLLGALPTVPASARSISSSNLKNLSTNLNRGKHLTYYVQYTTVSNGQKSTVTIAQAPPKSYFGSANGAVINNGKTTYYCSNAGDSGTSGNSGNSGNSGSGATTTTAKASMTCVSSKLGGTAALALEDLFSPAIALAAFNEAENTRVARALGIHVSGSSATYGGQPSTCVTVTNRSKSGKYCVTKQGILSYVSTTGSGYFELTKYSSKPPASLFTLPSGATTETLPGGGSVP